MENWKKWSEWVIGVDDKCWPILTHRLCCARDPYFRIVLASWLFFPAGYCPRLSRSVVLPQASLPPQKWSLDSETLFWNLGHTNRHVLTALTVAFIRFNVNFTILGKAAVMAVQGLCNVSWTGRGRPALGQFATFGNKRETGSSITFTEDFWDCY